MAPETRREPEGSMARAEMALGPCSSLHSWLRGTLSACVSSSSSSESSSESSSPSPSFFSLAFFLVAGATGMGGPTKSSSLSSLSSPLDEPLVFSPLTPEGPSPGSSAFLTSSLSLSSSASCSSRWLASRFLSLAVFVASATIESRSKVMATEDFFLPPPNPVKPITLAISSSSAERPEEADSAGGWVTSFTKAEDPEEEDFLPKDPNPDEED